MDSILYGKSWFRAKKRFTSTWNEEEAKSAHEKRQPYAAAVISSGVIRCFLEVNNEYFGVGFLDDRQREYLCYQFQEIQPGRLFLTMATHREYDGESDRVKAGTTYYFKPDGRVTIESEDFGSTQLVTTETKRDVEGNWERYPNFGEYESVLRIDR